MKTLIKYVKQLGSNVRCKVCGGWGGEWGGAQGVGPMCYECYIKKYGK